MVGAVNQQHRVIRKQRIQVVAAELATVAEVGDVIAVANDPVPRLQRVRIHVLTKHPQDVRNAGHRAGGHTGDVGPLHDLGGVGKMAMSIDERRHQGAPCQINHHGALTGGGHHLGLIANSQDAFIANRHGLGHGSLIHHGEDRATTEDHRSLGHRHGVLDLITPNYIG